MMLHVLQKYLETGHQSDTIFYSRMERGTYKQGEFPEGI